MNKKVDKVNDKKKKSTTVSVSPATIGGGTPMDRLKSKKK